MSFPQPDVNKQQSSTAAVNIEPLQKLRDSIQHHRDRLEAGWQHFKQNIHRRLYGDRQNLPARTIFINIRPPADMFDRKGVYQVNYASNEIHTTKYNLLTFLPKNLLEQFRRLANFYFLALVVLQCLPMFQVSSPFYAALPIAFIVLVTAMKDGFEDWKRHLSDNEINGSTTKTMAVYVNCNYLGVELSTFRKVKKLASSYYRSLTGRKRPFAVGDGQVELMNLDTEDETAGDNTLAMSASETEMAPADASISLTNALTVESSQAADEVLASVSNNNNSNNNNNNNEEEEEEDDNNNIDDNINNNIDNGDEIIAAEANDRLSDLPIRLDSLRDRYSADQPPATATATPSIDDGQQQLTVTLKPVKRKSLRKKLSKRLSSKQRKSDAKEGRRKKRKHKSKKPKPTGWRPRHWEDLQVGDVVFLRNNDPVPADVIVLNTSEPDGLCYIETKNLDGETNLKIRSGFPQFSYLDSKQKIQDLHMTIEVEPPNTHVYSFNAAICIAEHQQQHQQHNNQQQQEQSSDPFTAAPATPSRLDNPKKLPAASAIGGLSEKKIPVTINELLLRGCTLRNVDWVIGVVVYTGEDTKLLMNSGETPSKRSMVEISMNIQVFLMLLFLLIVCAVVSIGSYIIAQQATSSRAPYLFPANLDASVSQSAFYVFIASLIMLQNIVPISLYVTAEFVKLIQAYLIYCDAEMYYEPVDKPCIPKTWTIADDLGQIEYLFSDKTGTLTKNVMEFRKCSIGGVMYGQMLDEIAKTVSEESQQMLRELSKAYENPYADKSITFFDSDRFPRHLADTTRPQSSIIKEFFTHLSICHTVLAEYPDEDDQFTIQYKAQSPDEAALVATAKNCGFAFLDRVQDEVSVNILGQDIDFKLLHLIEFNSDRKRMSVIVQTPDGTILLYIKGADSVIFERLGSGQKEMREQTFEHLENFASDGLRTLCLAYRVIQPAEYVSWSAEYAHASALIEDREKSMDAVAEKIERDLLLLGATAIEDQLQDGVPDCIARLSKAGIKIWVLTGDKMETAINIGFSCCLLTREMVLVVIKGHDEQSVGEQIKEALDRCFSLDAAVLAGERKDEEINDFGERLPQHLHNPAAAAAAAASSSTGAERNIDETGKVENENNEESDGEDSVGSGEDVANSRRPFALVIDGESLKHSLDGQNRAALLELACRCKAVICCRVSPLQKAQVVQLVKEGKRVMTMAIGDGANDVSMIQQANVGVGISGQEGVQAVMASDYAIAQFRFLTHLLLVHGRWSYLRFSEMVLLMFQKNFIWTLVLFWYQFYSGFTATILYNYFFILFFNVVFTGLPPIIIGAFDQDIQAKQAVQVPAMYRGGIRHQYYGTKTFLSYVFDGIYQSLVCFFTAFWLVAEDGPLNTSGYNMDFTVLGTVSATIAIINANLYMGFCTHYWTWLSHLSIWGSILVFMGVVLVGTIMASSTLYGVLSFTYGCLAFWLAVPVSVVLCFLPKYLRVVIRVWWHPSDVDILREITLFNLESWQFICEEDLVSPLSSEPEISERRSSLPPLAAAPSDQQQRKEESQHQNVAAAFAQKLNQQLDRRIGEPLKRQFSQIPARFRRAASMLVMKNGRLERNTGFAFSQQPGIVSHLSNLGVESPVTRKRRASKFQSDSALERQPAGRLDSAGGSAQSLSQPPNAPGLRNGNVVAMSPPYWVQHLQRALRSTRPRSRRGSGASSRQSSRHASSTSSSPILAPISSFPGITVAGPSDLIAQNSPGVSAEQNVINLPGSAIGDATQESKNHEFQANSK